MMQFDLTYLSQSSPCYLKKIYLNQNRTKVYVTVDKLLFEFHSLLQLCHFCHIIWMYSFHSCAVCCILLNISI